MLENPNGKNKQQNMARIVSTQSTRGNEEDMNINKKKYYLCRPYCQREKLHIIYSFNHSL